MSGHDGLNVSESDATSCVPDSLYMLLQLLFGGEQLFEDEKQDGKEAEVRRKVLSCAQDSVRRKLRQKDGPPSILVLAALSIRQQGLRILQTSFIKRVTLSVMIKSFK